MSLTQHPDFDSATPALQAIARCHPDKQFELVVKFLGTEDADKLETARQLLLGIGKSVVPELIDEALSPHRRPAHAVRLLDVVGDIGQPVGVSDWMRLCTGGGSRDPMVRAKCAELIVRLGHAVPDRN